VGTKQYNIPGARPAAFGNQCWPEPVTIDQDLYIEPPVVANPFDDEFQDGSPDLAARGWTFINRDANTPMVRAGDVYPYEYAWTGGVGSLTKNQYRSSIRNGRLALQLSTIATEYSLYKPIVVPHAAAAEGCVIWSRFGSSRALDTAGAHGFTSVALWDDAAGVPDPNNRLYYEIFYDGISSFLSWTAVNGGAFTTKQQQLGDTSPADMFMVMTTASDGAKFANFDVQSGADASTPFYPAPTYPSSDRIKFGGMNFFVPTPAPERVCASIRYIDFIRLRTGDMKALCSTSEWLYPDP